MIKSLIWISKIAAAGILISVLSIWTTGYIVTSYIESIVKQYNLPIAVQPVAMSGLWGQLWGAEERPSTQQIEPLIENEDSSLDPTTENGSKPLPSDPNEATEVLAPVSEDTIGEEIDSLIDPQDTEVAVTPEEILETKNAMTEEDKDQVFNLLMEKLSPNTWQSISFYLEDGLTDEEIIEVQQILAQQLDYEQYEEIMKILKKY